MTASSKPITWRGLRISLKCSGSAAARTNGKSKISQFIIALIALNPQRICYGHFGCYDNAVEQLRRARQQILDWHKIANGEKARGKSPGQIMDVIRSKDPELDYLNGLDKDAFERESVLLLNTVRGLSGISPQN